ncbi:MAG: hypothetical protein WBV78_16205, partial [Roseobacter sp.]
MIVRTGFYFDVFRTFEKVLLVAVAIAFCLTAQAHADEPSRPEYVGSETCAACHTDAVDDWQGSHHDLAWTLPSAETVVGQFDGRAFTHQGKTYRFTTRDGQYFIDTDDAKG